MTRTHPAGTIPIPLYFRVFSVPSRKVVPASHPVIAADDLIGNFPNPTPPRPDMT